MAFLYVGLTRDDFVRIIRARCAGTLRSAPPEGSYALYDALAGQSLELRYVRDHYQFVSWFDLLTTVFTEEELKDVVRWVCLERNVSPMDVARESGARNLVDTAMALITRVEPVSARNVCLRVLEKHGEPLWCGDGGVLYGVDTA